MALAIGGGVVNSALFNGRCWSVGYRATLHFKDSVGYLNSTNHLLFPSLTSDPYVLEHCRISNHLSAKRQHLEKIKDFNNL